MTNLAMSPQEKKELMDVGAEIIADIKTLLEGTSPSIKVNFRHGIKNAQTESETRFTKPPLIILLFTITDLGVSKESEVKTFIADRLLYKFKDLRMLKYDVEWAFEVE